MGGLAVGCLEFPGGGVDGLNGDLVAEAFEAADVVAGLAAVVRAAFVVVGAEVGVDGFGVREQGVVDGQQGVPGGDEGFLLGHPPGQPPVFRAGEGVGAAGADGGFAEGGAEVAIAAAGGAGSLALAAGLGDLRHHFAQDTRWAAAGKTVMSVPISAMTSWAVMTPVPDTASSCAIWRAYGSHKTSILAVSSAIQAVW